MCLDPISALYLCVENDLFKYVHSISICNIRIYIHPLVYLF